MGVQIQPRRVIDIARASLGWVLSRIRQERPVLTHSIWLQAADCVNLDIPARRDKPGCQSTCLMQYDREIYASVLKDLEDVHFHFLRYTY